MASREEVSAFVGSSTWSIVPARLAAIMEALEQPHAAPVQAAHQRQRATTGPVGSVAVLPVHGPISYRSGPFSFLFGGATITGLSRALSDVLATRSVDTIVLDIDSPGGVVDGVEEFAAELRQARSQTPIIAVVNTLAASAAYWLAAQADEVVISPSAEAGSVGVFSLHLDRSKQLALDGIAATFIFAGKHKVDANPLEPLSTAARADLQTRVDEIHGTFIGDIARGRRSSASAVRAYADGRLFSARAAVRLGLADRIGTFDETLARGLSSAGRRDRALGAQPQADRDLLDATLAEMACPATGPSPEERAQAAPDREMLDDVLHQMEHAELMDELEELDPGWRRHG